MNKPVGSMPIPAAHRLRAAEQPGIVAGIPGMPPFVGDQAPLSFYEFWPPKLFYIPIAFTWAVLALRHRGLTLPTVANPLFPDGSRWADQCRRGCRKNPVLEIAVFDRTDPDMQ
jgi:hypothetical protein